MEIMITRTLEPCYAATLLCCEVATPLLPKLMQGPEGSSFCLLAALIWVLASKRLMMRLAWRHRFCAQTCRRLTRLSLVFVQGIDGIEEDHDARGDPYRPPKKHAAATWTW